MAYLCLFKLLTSKLETETKSFFFLKINLFNLFIFGCIGASLLHTGFSLVEVSGGYFSLRCVASLVAEHGCTGFSTCGSRAVECRLSSCGARA